MYSEALEVFDSADAGKIELMRLEGRFGKVSVVGLVAVLWTDVEMVGTKERISRIVLMRNNEGVAMTFLLELGELELAGLEMTGLF